ncbi:group II intron maturase-specific domain-containing protein [Streptomyces sp. NPDC021218]|uniref:group II intron maturase-specific domain-containing protein n=1 Tax=Streptomyces sp. NPDC021218 TaxID=3365119 RepID=UPI0037A51B3E
MLKLSKPDPSEEKTSIVHLNEGCDFLGFNVRRYRGGAVLLIKPTTAAVRRIRKRLAAEVKALRGANAEAVIHKLNPIIRGWAAYYRSVVSSRVFHALYAYVWKLVYKWAAHTHPNKQALGHHPLLRHVQQGQAGQVGLR